MEASHERPRIEGASASMPEGTAMADGSTILGALRALREATTPEITENAALLGSLALVYLLEHPRALEEFQLEYGDMVSRQTIRAAQMMLAAIGKAGED